MVGKPASVILVAIWLNLLTTISALAAGDAELSLKLEKTGIEIGRVFLGVLDYNGKSGSGPADLRPWEKNFLVERSNFSMERKSGRFHSTEDIRLYPRRSGTLVINAIAHGGVIMEPLKVQVKPLTRNGINGDPIFKPLPRQVQIGSPLEVAVEVPLLHPSNSVITDPRKIAGARVISLPQETIERENHVSVVLHWKIFAQHKGEYQIELPAIYQRGNGKWRFHLPLQTVEFFPLPSYLPPTLPVGQLTLTSKLVAINSKRFWRIEIHNTGLLGDEIYGLRTALAKATGIAENEVEITPPTTTSSGGQVSIYQLPVPQWTLDFWHGPKITQQYFDPAKGDMEAIQLYLPATWRLPGWASAIVYLLTGMISLALLFGLYQLGLKIIRWLAFLNQIQQADNPHALRKLLLERNHCKTLEQWAGTRGTMEATLVADELNALCFCNSTKHTSTTPETTSALDTLKKRLTRIRPEFIFRIRPLLS
ncbi:MAG TPA: hypothetical protein ENJ35_04910 [Gammaproteobacteria bacterium]|nr:hypothetical protein [Gammaproteobacteria bacterium]